MMTNEPSKPATRSTIADCCLMLFILLLACAVIWPQTARAQDPQSEKVIIDTDIGDDVDDAFALALALRSPELQILGVTTTFGDTQLRAQLAERLLSEAGRADIPVAAGAATRTNSPFTQRAYAEGGHFDGAAHQRAVDFLLEQIRRYPNQITLIGIGPLVNVGAAIDKDPTTFRKLKRVVIMGGSIYRGYDAYVGYGPPVPPSAEWNIIQCISGAQKLFASGVPLYVMPLDSTQLKLDEVKRAFLFRQGRPLTDALTILYHEWGYQTPTLFDPMAVSFAIKPDLCPVTPLRIQVDSKGFTLPEPGTPNAQVCLKSNPDQFFAFYLQRVAAP